MTKRMRRRFAYLVMGAAGLILSGCSLAPLSTARPPSAPPPDAAPYAASEESLAFAQHYAAIEARLLADGLLRSDGGRVDAPFTAAMLAENFERIALYDEYVLRAGRFIARETPSRLRRWEAPVQIQPHFGRAVGPDQKARDLAILTAYADRLSRVSGHPVTVVPEGGNFHVLYLDRDEQKAAGPILEQLVPGVGRETITAVETMPRATFCSVFAFSQGGGQLVYKTAVAIIRTEHPDLLRRACVHEEVAQGLGLPNDSARARPSIFNDDEEFALLTPHDELLLRILYDPRLSPGMTPDEARPILRTIAQELVGGPS